MINIEKTPLQNWEAFTPDNKSLGKLNMIEFLNLRVQVKRLKLEGYYILFQDEFLSNLGENVYVKIMILPNGKLDDHPKNLYHTELLRDLLIELSR